MIKSQIKHYQLTNITNMALVLEDIGVTLQAGESTVINAAAFEKSSDLQQCAAWVKMEPVVIPQKGPPNPVRLVGGDPVSPGPPPAPAPPPMTSEEAIEKMTESLRIAIPEEVRRALDGVARKHEADMDRIASLLSQILDGSSSRPVGTAVPDPAPVDAVAPMVLPGNIVPDPGSIEARVKTEEGEIDADDFDANRKALKRNRSGRKRQSGK